MSNDVETKWPPRNLIMLIGFSVEVEMFADLQ